MGLDIYLYKHHVESVAKLREIKREINRLEESVWEDGREYKSYSESELETIREKSAELVGTYTDSIALLDWKDSDSVGEEQVELPSELHPDHLFKLGYFRSSYNAGGIDARARDFDLPSLASVLVGDEEEDYYVEVDWENALVRAKDALAKWKAESDRVGLFDVYKESGNIFMDQKINNESDALNAVLKEADRWAKNDGGFDSYSTGEGMFSKSGMKVHGVFVGTTEFLSRRTPCTYLVVKLDEPALDWYVKAWEIVVETCEYVLKQEDPSKFFLHWSS